LAVIEVGGTEAGQPLPYDGTFAPSDRPILG